MLAHHDHRRHPTQPHPSRTHRPAHRRRRRHRHHPLALELPLPHGDTNHDLLHALAEHRDEYIAFPVSFAVIAAHRTSHHALFRQVDTITTHLGRLNLLWLFAQVLTPFATRLLSGDGAFETRFTAYALVQALSGLTWLLMLRQLHRPDAQPDVTADATGHTWAMLAGFLTSIPLAFLTHWAYACWAVIPIGHGLPHPPPPPPNDKKPTRNPGGPCRNPKTTA
ncbi:TMEM175 family protein [Actinokineospora auranticolor]|uniref:TMEM175 family protein n=1 Tax=Actinokineospora auranticolor TaxID=155976 RepID=UPI0035A81959